MQIWVQLSWFLASSFAWQMIASFFIKKPFKRDEEFLWDLTGDLGSQKVSFTLWSGTIYHDLTDTRIGRCPPEVPHSQCVGLKLWRQSVGRVRRGDRISFQPRFQDSILNSKIYRYARLFAGKPILKKERYKLNPDVSMVSKTSPNWHSARIRHLTRFCTVSWHCVNQVSLNFLPCNCHILMLWKMSRCFNGDTIERNTSYKGSLPLSSTFVMKHL